MPKFIFVLFIFCASALSLLANTVNLAAPLFAANLKVSQVDRARNIIIIDLEVSNKDASLQAINFRLYFESVYCNGFKVPVNEIIIPESFRPGRLCRDSNLFSYRFDTVLSAQKKPSPRTVIKFFLQPKMKIPSQGSFTISIDKFCASDDKGQVFAILPFDRSKSTRIEFNGETAEDVAKNLEGLRKRTVSYVSSKAPVDSLSLNFRIYQVSEWRSEYNGGCAAYLGVTNSLELTSFRRLYFDLVVPKQFVLDSVVSSLDNKRTSDLIEIPQKDTSIRYYSVVITADKAWLINKSAGLQNFAKLYLRFSNYASKNIDLSLRNISARNEINHEMNKNRDYDFNSHP